MIRLNPLERVGYAVVVALALATALAWSPLWPHIPDITFLLPPGYAELIESLPGEPNTSLATLILLGITLGAFFLPRDPVVPLGILTAAVLGTAAYPYGNVRWHRLFADMPVDEASPTLGAWLRALVPVLLVMALPLIDHLRHMQKAYTEKGIDANERRQVLVALGRGSGIALLLAVAGSLLLGLLLSLGGRLLTSESRLLGRNSVVVMLLVAVLLVAALGLGTGLFSRGPGDPEDTGDRETPGPRTPNP